MLPTSLAPVEPFHGRLFPEFPVTPKDPNAAFFFVPDDPSDIAAGGICGTFDGRQPPPPAVEQLFREARLKAGEKEEPVRVRLVPMSEELSAILNAVAKALEESDAIERPESPFTNAMTNLQQVPPVSLFEVVRVHKKKGLRVRQLGLGGHGSSVWIESPIAARHFKKRDAFFLGWDDKGFHFVPPDRRSWRL